MSGRIFNGHSPILGNCTRRLLVLRIITGDRTIVLGCYRYVESLEATFKGVQ